MASMTDKVQLFLGLGGGDETTSPLGGAGLVFDADTVVPAGADKSVRIKGIDAFETSKPGGTTATNFVRRNKNNLSVTVAGQEGHFGRNLGTATFDTGADLGKTLVRRGLAVPKSPQLYQVEAQSVARALLQDRFKDPTRDELSKERAQKGFHPLDAEGASGINLRNKKGTFATSAARGVDQLQALSFGAVNALGSFVGADTVAAWGRAGLERNLLEAAANPAEIQSFDQVETLSQFGTYALEAVGEQLPILATMVTGAGVLGGLARASIGKALLRKAMDQELRALAGGAIPEGSLIAPSTLNDLAGAASKKAILDAQKSFIFRNSASLGAGAASFPLGVGEVQQSLLSANIDSPGTALLAGIPFAALDAVGFEAVLGRLFKGISIDAAKSMVRTVGKELVKSAGLGSATEASTEMLQEIISLTARAAHDPTFEIFSDKNIAQIKEAGIKAGLVGGLFAGAGGGVAAAIAHSTGTKADLTTPVPEQLRLAPPEQQLALPAPSNEGGGGNPPSAPPPSTGGVPPPPPSPSPSSVAPREPTQEELDLENQISQVNDKIDAASLPSSPDLVSVLPDNFEVKVDVGNGETAVMKAKSRILQSRDRIDALRRLSECMRG